MFDRFSDYALNKMDQEAIVCKSATGVHIRLTREDFSSEAEFLHWKVWSDQDYHETEAAGRGDDGCYRVNAERDTTGLSAEDDLIAKQDQAESERLDEEKQRQKKERLETVRSILTEKQFRRLWMFHVENLNIKQISEREDTTHQSISESLSAARKKIMNKM